MKLLQPILILILLTPTFSLAKGKDIFAENPICGVLTNSGYLYTESELVFLVPLSSTSPVVRRYSVKPGSTVIPPLEVLANWWVCISAGEIISEPKENSPEFYGLIKIEEISIDQSNGERGQE